MIKPKRMEYINNFLVVKTRKQYWRFMMVLLKKGQTLEGNHSLLQNRLFINNLLRLLLDSPPTMENIRTLEELHDFHSLCEFSDGAKILKDFINSLESEGEFILLQVKDEYNSLLVGPDILPAPPWESVYLGKENLLFEEQTLKVRECYKEYSLKFIRENNEPEDHIVIELEFLAYLIHQTLECENSREVTKLWKDQAAFLDGHFLQWTPKFCELLLKNVQSNWFKGAAFLLNEYIEFEQEVSAIIKEAIENE
jgi:putative dimethyl sulfoxide reductase chaperone